MDQQNRSSAVPSRVVFVGNIPWDKNEADLQDIFSTIGPIVAFRLLYDRETGRSRGYGFCEYEDSEMAKSAIRNLNGYEFGGRQLRVDYAENDQMPSAMSANTPMHVLQAQQQMAAKRGPQVGPLSIPPLLQPMASEEATPESINRLLSAMQPNQLYDILSQLKTMASQNYEQTKQLLMVNPALAYAIHQALTSMNLMDLTKQQQLQATPAQNPSQATPAAPRKHVTRQTQTQQAQTGQAPQSQPQHMFPPVPPTVSMMPPPMPPHPSQFMPPHMQPQFMGMMPPPIPPPPHLLPQHQMMGTPSMSSAHQQSASIPNEAQREMILRQIMSMSMEQINALPPEQRDQVLMIRNQALMYQQQQQQSKQH